MTTKLGTSAANIVFLVIILKNLIVDLLRSEIGVDFRRFGANYQFALIKGLGNRLFEGFCQRSIQERLIPVALKGLITICSLFGSGFEKF